MPIARKLKVNPSIKHRHGVRSVTMKNVVLIGLMLALAATESRADILLYQIPNTDLVITLRGRYKPVAGGNAFFTHPKLGRLTMDIRDVVEHHA